MAPLKRPMRAAHGDQPPTIGKDVSILKFGLHRYGTLGPAGVDFFPIPAHVPPTPVYNPRTKEAVTVLQELERGAGNDEIKLVSGDVGQATWNVVWEYLDAYRRAQYRVWRPPKPPSPVPELGPIYAGGSSVLLHELTHESDGVPRGLWPAFDDGWVAGRTIIAPEDMRVTEQSGSAGGDAVYCRGASGLEYWIAHMAVAPWTGKTFSKGDKVGTIANIPQSQGGPHVHCGINALPLLGIDLLYGKTGRGPDYTYGSPTVGEQLRRALA